MLTFLRVASSVLRWLNHGIGLALGRCAHPLGERVALNLWARWSRWFRLAQGGRCDPIAPRGFATVQGVVGLPHGFF